MEIDFSRNSSRIYRNIFPTSLRYAIRALDNEKRQLLVGILAFKKVLRFNELREYSGIEGNDLSYHLKELEKGNIIRKEAEDMVIYYRLTPFGERLLENLLKAVLVPRSEKKGGKVRKLPEFIYDREYREELSREFLYDTAQYAEAIPTAPSR